MKTRTPEDQASLSRRIRGRAILLDTNLLVVVFVGLWRQEAVGRRATGDEYDRVDFQLLARLVEDASPWILTPHLLTEVDNRLGYIQSPGQEECRKVAAEMIKRHREFRPAAIKVIREKAYPRLGVADAAIIRISRKHRSLVLTADHALYEELIRLGQDAIYYPAIKQELLRADLYPDLG